MDKQILKSGAAALALAACLAGNARAGAAESGQALFDGKCAVCHTIGGGDRTGPDLRHVTSRRDRAWMENFILNPGISIASGDQAAISLMKKFNGLQMPALGLSREEVGRILEYLGGGGSPRIHEAQSPADGASTDTGKKLFTGSLPFLNGGAPCVACHTLASLDSLGGGSLGPDLSDINEKFGADGIVSILESPPFPTMKPIYDTRAISAREQRDLAAFFASLPARPPSSPIVTIAAMAGGAALACLCLIALIWRHRLSSVRQSLIARRVKKEE